MAFLKEEDWAFVGGFDSDGRYQKDWEHEDCDDGGHDYVEALLDCIARAFKLGALDFEEWHAGDGAGVNAGAGCFEEARGD